MSEDWIIFNNFYNDISNLSFNNSKDDKGVFYSLDKDILGIELYSRILVYSYHNH